MNVQLIEGDSIIQDQQRINQLRELKELLNFYLKEFSFPCILTGFFGDDLFKKTRSYTGKEVVQYIEYQLDFKVLYTDFQSECIFGSPNIKFNIESTIFEHQKGLKEVS